MSQDIGDTRTCDCRSGVVISGVCGRVLWVLRWAGSRGGGQDQLAKEFAGGGVHDPDLEVLDEQDDAGSGVGSADADVVQLAVLP